MMRVFIIALLTLTQPTYAGGDADTNPVTACYYDDGVYSDGAIFAPDRQLRLICVDGEWHDHSCQSFSVPEDPIVLISKPKLASHTVCMIYDTAKDGPEPGALRLTLRDPSAAANAPHDFSELILGFAPTLDATETASCLTVDIDRNQVLAAVKSAGSGTERELTLCPARN